MAYHTFDATTTNVYPAVIEVDDAGTFVTCSKDMRYHLVHSGYDGTGAASIAPVQVNVNVTSATVPPSYDPFAEADKQSVILPGGPAVFVGPISVVPPPIAGGAESNLMLVCDTGATASVLLFREQRTRYS